MDTDDDPSPQSPAPTDESPAASSRAGGFRLSDLRRSDRILGGFAGILLVSGLLLQGFGALRGAAPAPESSRLLTENGSRTSRALQPGGSLVDDRGAGRSGSPSPSSSEESPGGDDLFEEWSPAMIRGGFGFFVGFAVGLALRVFLRLSIIIVGLNLLLLFGLSYLGWLEVRWDTIDSQFSQWMLSLESQFTELKSFIAGSLPTAGLSGAGLLMGFRKR